MGLTMGQDEKLPITSIALVVEDVQRSIKFYRDKVGLDLVRVNKGFGKFESPIADLALWEAGLVREGLGINAGAIDGKLRKMMIACRLDSPRQVDAWHDELNSRGVEFVAPPQSHDWNVYAVYFADPDGNIWELFTWQEGGPPEDIPVDEA